MSDHPCYSQEDAQDSGICGRIGAVVGLELFAESLNGKTLAKHFVETLIGNPNDRKDHGLNLHLNNLIATAIDRASINKRGLDILKTEYGVNTFSAYCFSHGRAMCGKRAHMTVGQDVLKHLTSMVKYSL